MLPAALAAMLLTACMPQANSATETERTICRELRADAPTYASRADTPGNTRRWCAVHRRAGRPLPAISGSLAIERYRPPSDRDFA
ncbi:MAG: hypothetical protein U5N55_07940 [Cypionkella sp.]|nr:hypothetical protein [Cypionkella sp.]